MSIEHRNTQKGGELLSDDRPLVRLMFVMLQKNGRKESAVYGIGGRQNYDTYLDEKNWKMFVMKH